MLVATITIIIKAYAFITIKKQQLNQPEVHLLYFSPFIVSAHNHKLLIFDHSIFSIYSIS